MPLQHAKNIIVFSLAVILSTSLFTAFGVCEYKTSARTGVQFIESLYGAKNLTELEQKQLSNLREIAAQEVLYNVALAYNSNRLQYTYYGMEDAEYEIKPLYRTVTDKYIEFTVSIDGKDDGRIRGVWFTANHGKIIAFKEALLFPFPKDEVSAS